MTGLEEVMLCQRKFRLDIRKNFFKQRIVEYLNRMPREGAESPSLESFKRNVAMTLRSMDL